MPLDLVEGWTGPIDYDLLADGTPVNASSSNGDVVSLVLHNRAGTTVSTTGDVTFLTSSTGRVRYLPGVNDLVAQASPYRARFRIENNGQIVFFPSGPAEQWTVYPP